MDFDTRSAEQQRGRTAERQVVIHQIHNWCIQIGHVTTVVGNVKANTEPPAGSRSKQSWPSWYSMIERQMASPMPMPFAFVVKNGVKSCGSSATEMPAPRSV